MKRLSRWTDPAVLEPGFALLVGILVAALVARAGWGPSTLAFSLPKLIADPLLLAEHSDVTLIRPSALWLLPIAVIPMLVVVLRHSLVDARPFQLGLQALTRIAVLMAAALAIAQPTVRSPITAKSVVMVIDVSDSMDDEQLAWAQAQVDRAFDQMAKERDQGVHTDDRTRISVVTYAAEPTILDHTSNAPSITRLSDGLASDHAAALQVATTLFAPDTEGRVVLVTDGHGSLAEREQLKAALDDLSQQGLEVSVQSPSPGVADDVWLQALHLPTDMRLGETFEIAVDLASTHPGSVALHLEQNGEPNPLESVKSVELRAGPQQVTFTARVTKPGPVVFRAVLASEEIDPQFNKRTENDHVSAIGEVQGRPKVLVIGSGGDAPLASALRIDHLDVDTVRGPDAPTDLEALRPYDLVILSDVSAAMVPAETEASLSTYVRDLGGGLIMVGGEHAFGLGGWQQTPIGPLLPVRFEGERQREQPQLALILVIDKSGSMSAEDKLDLVKEAARATAQTLDASDEIGIIAFDSQPHVLVRLQSASNRIRISSDIRRLSSGGGTNALPALREAYLQLAGSRALIKHVILLSDGQSPEAGVSALLGDMRDADITVSTVGVGAGAGKDFLRRIAHRGRGRFHYSHDGTDVPRIFSRETQEVTKNAIQERIYRPVLAKNVQALRGIDFGAAPGLRGLVPVIPKSMSEVLLRTHTGEPLLVRSRRGLGQTVAFSSDAKARWAASWIGWSGFAKLWSQVARDTMRQGAALLGGAHLRIRPGDTPSHQRVIVDVESPVGFANHLIGDVELTRTSSSPDDATTSPLELTAPGRYEALVPATRVGQQLVKARLFDGSQTPPRIVAEAVGAMSISYPAELEPSVLSADPMFSHADAQSVTELLERPGHIDGEDRRTPLWPTVLWALLLPLMAVDLLIRRVLIPRSS